MIANDIARSLKIQTRNVCTLEPSVSLIISTFFNKEYTASTESCSWLYGSPEHTESDPSRRESFDIAGLP